MYNSFAFLHTWIHLHNCCTPSIISSNCNAQFIAFSAHEFINTIARSSLRSNVMPLRAQIEFHVLFHLIQPACQSHQSFRSYTAFYTHAQFAFSGFHQSSSADWLSSCPRSWGQGLGCHSLIQVPEFRAEACVRMLWGVLWSCAPCFLSPIISLRLWVRMHPCCSPQLW